VLRAASLPVDAHSNSVFTDGDPDHSSGAEYAERPGGNPHEPPGAAPAPDGDADTGTHGNNPPTGPDAAAATHPDHSTFRGGDGCGAGSDR